MRTRIIRNEVCLYSRNESKQLTLYLSFFGIRCLPNSGLFALWSPPITWLCFGIYRAFISPMSKIPGPWHSLLTNAWLVYQEFTSMRRSYIHELHQRYGPVVRLGPSQVSFITREAIKEIYTSEGSGYDKTEFYTLFMQFGERYTRRWDELVKNMC